MRFLLSILLLGFALLAGTAANAAEYELTIARESFNLTGKPVEKITVNGGIPGPTLRFKEGEDVVIAVTNKLDEDTSIHWHGLILPGDMDGVPGFNGFPGIRPAETFTYRFKARQVGTYWYHAHSIGQEQDGHYGSIIIAPRGGERIKAARDYVVLLSDFHDEDADDIFANLKMSADYYQYARRTVFDFFNDVEERGWRKAWSDAAMWGNMRMLPTDLSDVSGYTFLVNGKTPDQNWTGLFTPGERVRLRFINASAMSFYDVRIPGLSMQVIEADGQGVEPVSIDEFRFGPAETYDVIVTPKDDAAYTIAAESIDRTGFALGTLAPREGMRGVAPAPRARTLLTMADMGMDPSTDHAMKMDHGAITMGEEAMPMHHDGMAMSHDMKMDHGAMPAHAMGDAGAAMQSGWADAGTPAGAKALSYADLRYAGTQGDVRPPGREIEVELGGNMERYIWTINGKRFEDSGPIALRYGERVRLKFTNTTMMAHPMHLHGMFVQLENGQPATKLPNKHTVVVQPGQTYAVLLTADQPGEWAFHCHLLYHMMAGMMAKVVVATLDADAVPAPKAGPSHAARAPADKDREPEAAAPDQAAMPHDMKGIDHSAMPMTTTPPSGGTHAHH